MTTPAGEGNPREELKKVNRGCAVFALAAIGLFVVAGFLAWESISDHLESVRSDDILQIGGGRMIHGWVTDNGFLVQLQKGGIPIGPSGGKNRIEALRAQEQGLIAGPQSPPDEKIAVARKAYEIDKEIETLQKQMRPRFVIWVFGEDFREYRTKELESPQRQCHATDLGTADYGNVDKWREADSVLLVRLARAGTEKHDMAHASNGGVFNNIETTETFTIYSAEAWLVDKKSHHVFAHTRFEPGELVDYSGTPPGFPSTIGPDDIRFRAVDNAVAWARNQVH